MKDLLIALAFIVILISPAIVAGLSSKSDGSGE
jgi:hypothetical protein